MILDKKEDEIRDLYSRMASSNNQAKAPNAGEINELKLIILQLDRKIDQEKLALSNNNSGIAWVDKDGQHVIHSDAYQQIMNLMR